VFGKGTSNQGNAETIAFSLSSSSGSTSGLSAEQQVFHTGLANLVAAIRHGEGVSFHKVMINIQLLVFALCWFGMV
jgi:hypothetical protein